LFERDWADLSQACPGEPDGSHHKRAEVIGKLWGRTLIRFFVWLQRSLHFQKQTSARPDRLSHQLWKNTAGCDSKFE